MPNRMITTSKRSLSLVTMSASGKRDQNSQAPLPGAANNVTPGLRLSMSDMLAIGNDGLLLPENSVRCLQRDGA